MMSSPKLAARQEVNALLEALGLIVLARPDTPTDHQPDGAELAASL
jgi:hypothetical protein